MRSAFLLFFGGGLSVAKASQKKSGKNFGQKLSTEHIFSLKIDWTICFNDFLLWDSSLPVSFDTELKEKTTLLSFDEESSVELVVNPLSRLIKRNLG